MRNNTIIPAIKAPVVSPVLTLVNPNRSPSSIYPKSSKPWGFYPATYPLGLHTKASQSSFKMKARVISKSSTSTLFIAMMNTVKIRRNILLTLDCAQPIGAFDRLILSVVQADHPDTTKDQLRRELDYLGERDLIKVEHRQDGRLFCKRI
jgi:hypothetical protein